MKYKKGDILMFVPTDGTDESFWYTTAEVIYSDTYGIKIALHKKDYLVTERWDRSDIAKRLRHVSKLDKILA